jgi:hypothetical protein
VRVKVSRPAYRDTESFTSPLFGTMMMMATSTSLDYLQITSYQNGIVLLFTKRPNALQHDRRAECKDPSCVAHTPCKTASPPPVIRIEYRSSGWNIDLS